MLDLLDTLGVKAAVLGDAGNAILDSAEKWNLGLQERFGGMKYGELVLDLQERDLALNIGTWIQKAEGCLGAYQ